MQNKSHKHYMQLCFDLALRGAGNVSPNPLVGSIIIRDEQIIGEGFHAKVGDDHAELSAIKNANKNLKGSTLYCNLEPCCHTNKRTAPCAQRIISEGISKVVIANLDPNPQVAGNGVKILEDAGIEVITGILKEEGLILNEIFFKHITQQMPFIQLKMAQTLDGKLATLSGDSKWITNEKSRAHVHSQRENYDGILVGATTARQDNPKLSIRVKGKAERCSKRFILSLSGDLSNELNLFQDSYKDQTYIICPLALKEKVTSGQNFIFCPMLDELTFDLEALQGILYQDYAITSLYIEGGQTIHTEFLKQNCFDRVSVFIAPKILGNGKSTIGNLHNENMKEALEFENIEWKNFGTDFMFTGLKKGL